MDMELKYKEHKGIGIREEKETSWITTFSFYHTF